MYSISEYFQHIEDASIEIQQQKEPVDRTTVLWWGVDGLRMNEDGGLEWISRRKKEPEPVQITPCVVPVYPSWLYGSPTWPNPYTSYHCQQMNFSTIMQIPAAQKMQNLTDNISAGFAAMENNMNRLNF